MLRENSVNTKNRGAMLSGMEASIALRMLKKAVQQGRSERKGEAYPCGTLSLFVKRERRWRTFSASC